MCANVCRYLVYSVIAGSTATGAARAQAPPAPGGGPAPAVAGFAQQPGDPQILDEGPIHEAFAEPVALDARPRIVVDQAPPEPVNELPPEVRPEGENVEWIPGYWMWSEEQGDFVWVSGVWRDVPPGRRWVPGHWLQDGANWVWISGFWAGVDVREVQMLPHPPATLEAGPSSPAPGDNFFWIPGAWIWHNNAYAWRAGYWYAGQPGWVWVPDYYCYTPAGSIFVSGYWDRPLWARGLLFAPVYWPARHFGFPAFTYTPNFAVNGQLLLASLYINTRWNSYWFGNGHWGHDHFRPWWDHHGWRHGYDPLWSYHRWHDGHLDDWEDHWRRQFDHHRQDWDRGLAGGPGGGGAGEPEPGAGRSGSLQPRTGREDAGRRGGIVADVRDLPRGASTRLVNVPREEMSAATQRLAQWEHLRSARSAVESSARGGPTVPLGEHGEVRRRAGFSGDASVGARPGIRLPGSVTGAETTGGSSSRTGTRLGEVGGVRGFPGVGTTGPRGSRISSAETGGLPGSGTGSGVSVGGQRRASYRGPSVRLPAIDSGTSGPDLGGATGSGLPAGSSQAWPGRQAGARTWSGPQTSRSLSLGSGPPDSSFSRPFPSTGSSWQRSTTPRSWQGGNFGGPPSGGSSSFRGSYRPQARGDFGGATARGFPGGGSTFRAAPGGGSSSFRNFDGGQGASGGVRGFSGSGRTFGGGSGMPAGSGERGGWSRRSR